MPAAVVAFLGTAAGAVYLLVQLAAVFVRPPADWPVSGALFAELLAFLGLLLLAGSFAYRLAAALTLAYSVDRNGLYISWLGNRAVVPLHRIESVDSGVRVRPTLGGLLRSVGYLHGQVSMGEGRVVHRFTTVPLGQALVLHTAADSYAISPQDVDAFVQDLEQRRRLGVVQELAAGVEAGRTFSYAFWDNPTVRRALALALLLNLALLGWLMTIYPGLPPLLDMRADATGAAAALAPRHQILFLPLAAAVLGLINLGLGLSFYRREPVGAQLLQLTTVGVQILFAIAAVTILL